MGGTQLPGLLPQLQSQGAHTESLSQATAGQAQAHSPGPLDGLVWHTPDRQVSPTGQASPRPYQTQAASAAQPLASAWLAQGSVSLWTHEPDELQVPPLSHTPMPNQVQELVASAPHEVASAWAVHGSVGAVPQEQGAHSVPDLQAGQVQLLVPLEGALPEPVLLPVVTTVPAGVQSQAQGAQAAPSGHTGQAQAQVPLSTQPEPEPPPQSQAQGGQALPDSQGAQAQVQLPPELPPEPPVQSHSICGQAAPAGQETGLTQAQLPPSLVLAWQ